MNKLKYDLIIFDYDGTLSPPREGSCGPFSFTLKPNVVEKIKALQGVGINLAIASNQSNKRSSWDIAEQMKFARDKLNIKNIMYETEKRLKKPSPYMLDFIIFVSDCKSCNVLFVGDAESDREAADAAGIDFMWAEEFFEW